VPFAFVGRVTEGAGVHVGHDDETVHYGDIRCEKDIGANVAAVPPGRMEPAIRLEIIGRNPGVTCPRSDAVSYAP